MNSEQLFEWKNKLVSEIEKLKAEADDLASQIQKKSHQLELVEKLIASHGNETTTHPVALVGNGTVPPKVVSSSPSVSPTEVKDHVYEILSDVNRPMNINEIHAEFIRRGYAIPGKGTPFNILVHVSRDAKNAKNGRFVWAARGTYAIREAASKKKVAKKSSVV